ncbi:MAG: hypothetical protein KF787_03985 [Phycisphaeraceae bacterium]|nr:hypothetical protein [Phycisphaerae bacterium]MBX3391787.1 hypothetical protein [Phycisphaeraceae bacterium]
MPSRFTCSAWTWTSAWDACIKARIEAPDASGRRIVLGKGSARVITPIDGVPCHVLAGTLRRISLAKFIGHCEHTLGLTP